MRGLKKLLAGGLLLGLLAFPFVIYFNAQALTDWWQLRGYTPPANVTSLAAQDSMTAYAQHVFYVNRPLIESDTGQFKKDCGAAEKTIILGCYHSNQDGIFVYNVQDPRLAGIQQVTSAHEMLHAAYDRLSSKDRGRVDIMLTDFFDHGLKDQRIMDTINSYRVTEPNDLVNEMHSIFGTEVTNLPAPLEQYYSKYFKDRSAVTKDAAAYEGEFTSRENQIKADDAKLNNMKSAIDAQEQSLRAQLIQINNDRAQLDSMRSSDRIAEYNALVNKLKNEIYIYNKGVVKMNSDIDSFNKLIDERNAVAGELASLNKAINTQQAPQAIQ